MTSLKHCYLVHHPRLRGARPRDLSDLPAGTLSIPAYLSALGFSRGQYKDAKDVPVGIGSLGGAYMADDVAQAAALWSCDVPTVEQHVVGGAQMDPTDQSANTENTLDTTIVSQVWSYLVGRPAKIVYVRGPNNSGGMGAVTQFLLDVGCKVASWSWGGPEANFEGAERASFSAILQASVGRGMTVLAASGDNSIDDGAPRPSCDYPAADPNVWAVGGTYLSVDPATGLRADESAWGDGLEGDSGGGGGFDPSQGLLAWEVGVTPGKNHGIPGSSAVADPESGIQIVDGGNVTAVGGTSAAAPFTAALVAVAKGVALARGGQVKGLLLPDIYAARDVALFDITTGSNGDAATTGWDPATGCGSPKGAAFIEALVAAMMKHPLEGAAAPSLPSA